MAQNNKGNKNKQTKQQGGKKVKNQPNFYKILTIVFNILLKYLLPNLRLTFL